VDETPLAREEFPILGRAYFLGGRASTSVKRLLGQAGVDEATIQRVSVACYEAEMNVVLHARSGYVVVEVHPERVTVVVGDQGPGIADLALAMTRGWSSASEEARSLGFGAGLGLPNICDHADEMAIETAPGKGVLLTLTFWRGGAEHDQCGAG
jgi:serine/threonine-protein kinase RsbT